MTSCSWNRCPSLRRQTRQAPALPRRKATHCRAGRHMGRCKIHVTTGSHHRRCFASPQTEKEINCQEKQEMTKLDTAISAVLAKGLRTKDIAAETTANTNTQQMGDAILKELQEAF
jgi:hypothetical protein